MISLWIMISGAHIWLTLAYYGDRRWPAYFAQQPVVFFLMPAAIVIAGITLVAQPYKPIGLTALTLALLVNIWHHAKQNWGIMCIVGKICSEDVSPWR